MGTFAINSRGPVVMLGSKLVSLYSSSRVVFVVNRRYKRVGDGRVLCRVVTRIVGVYVSSVPFNDVTTTPLRCTLCC